MPGVKNPMCIAFPRIGGDNLSVDCVIFTVFFQQVAITGDGGLVGDRRASMLSVFWLSILSMTRHVSNKCLQIFLYFYFPFLFLIKVERDNTY